MGRRIGIALQVNGRAVEAEVEPRRLLAGFLLAAHELLQRNPDPDEATIREYLSGNICRCTGYNGIVEAVRLAAARGYGRGGEGGP